MPAVLNPEGGYGAADDSGISIINMGLPDITPALVDWMNDKGVTEYLEAGKKSWSREEIKNWLIAQWKKRHHVFTIRVSGRVIGTLKMEMKLQDTGKGSDVERYAVIGIMLGEERGKGYGTRAIKLATWWVFRQLQPKWVEAGVLAGNEASKAAFIKAGFAPISTVKGVTTYRMEVASG
jgi:RimJ/RimL family protein N-acetyltransferase